MTTDRWRRIEALYHEMLASLNHPHIGAIYGLEDADGVNALVMELVEARISHSASRDGRCRWTRH